MAMAEIKKGSVVRALAGRDRQGFFAVLELTGDGFALIADGKSRPLEKPKRKRLKHLQATHTVLELEDFTNKTLRNILAAFRQKQENPCGALAAMGTEE